LAQRKQALLGPRRARVGGVPLGPAHGSQQHGIGAAADRQGFVSERGPVCVDRGAAKNLLLEVELTGDDCMQHFQRGARYLRSDAVAG
jgi:hypothetical protein